MRVILADDHALVRGGIRALLGGIEWISVVGEVSDGAELIGAAQSLRPDMVLTDISMPVMDGLAAISHLRGVDPQLRAVVLSMHDSSDLLQRAVDCGACAFIAKDTPPFELEHAMRCVIETGRYFSPGTEAQLLRARQRSPLDDLTARQVQVLTLIAHGRAAKQIGFELGLSPKTVDVHRAHIMKRLGLWDVASLTRFAIRMRLVKP